MAFKRAPSKDPESVEPYYFVFCDASKGINTGSKNDKGRLQGATIESIVEVVSSDPALVVDSSNTNEVTIRAVVFPVNTVVTAWLSGGTEATVPELSCKVITSDNRTLIKTMIVPIVSE